MFKTGNGAAPSERLRIERTGDVGIGTSSPQRTLHVYTSADEPPVRFEDSSGYCEINPTSTTWSCTSDQRLKENVGSLSSSHELDKLRSLRPVEFEWKSDVSDGKRIGLIAQEVEAIMPDLVNTDSQTGFKSVAYGGLTTYMLSALQELADRVEEVAQTSYDVITQTVQSIVVAGKAVFE